MLQDTLERVQARSARESCRAPLANPYPFGMGMQSDKNGKEEQYFVSSAHPMTTSPFNSQSR